MIATKDAADGLTGVPAARACPARMVLSGVHGFVGRIPQAPFSMIAQLQVTVAISRAHLCLRRSMVAEMILPCFLRPVTPLGPGPWVPVTVDAAVYPPG